MSKSKKKETRIMKITMNVEEFEKYDKGITHSDSGMRDEKGRLSALPDIAPINDDDLPRREVVRTETLYVERESTDRGISTAIGDAVANVIVDVLSDPEIQAGLAELGKAFWYYKVNPRIKDALQWIKGDKKLETKASQLMEHCQQDIKPTYEFEVVNERHGKYVVTGKEAAELVEAVREEARRLSSMIYLLSNITVKDEKTREDFMLEQAYIKQLLSDESKHTMEMLVSNSQLLEEETAICFCDFLDGYVCNGKRRIPISVVDIADSIEQAGYKGNVAT